VCNGGAVAESVVLVNGLPGAGKTTLAHALKGVTGWPCLSKDAVKEALGTEADGALTPAQLGAVAMDTVWSMAAGITGAVIIDSWWFAPRDLQFARAGVLLAGGCQVVEVWCEAGSTVARKRYTQRQRPEVHQDAQRLARDWDHWAAHAAPLDLWPVVRVSTACAVNIPAVADRIRELLQS